MARILVGVDGSDGSRQALQWAVDEAALRDTGIDVLNAYQTEYIYYVDLPAVAHAVPRYDLEAAAKMAVEDVVDSINNPAEIDIQVEYINSGNPAGELVLRSADHDLIVLGSRGLGGLAGLLLGSVTHKVVQHADCPVTIIPAED